GDQLRRHSAGPRSRRDDHDHRRDRRPRSCAAAGIGPAVRRRRQEGSVSGEEGARYQAAAAAEVQRAEVLAGQSLRAPARRIQEVRPLPDLPARAGAPGRDSGHDEVELVGEEEMLTDPIADMLSRIRNANKALHESVTMPSSKMKVEIARLL